uniref:Uncharacterized protein n=2 Tax=Oryza TaxID=4527 RepID=A0A0E0Q7S1_ORYRU
MAITPVDSPSPPSPISRANLHFSRLLALPAGDGELALGVNTATPHPSILLCVRPPCEQVWSGGARGRPPISVLESNRSLEKCQEIKIGGSHLAQVLLFTLQSLNNEVSLYNEKVVLQFAKDDDIGFGGSHSAQVLLSRDRKLTPVQCKVIAAMHRNPVHI